MRPLPSDGEAVTARKPPREVWVVVRERHTSALTKETSLVVEVREETARNMANALLDDTVHRYVLADSADDARATRKPAKKRKAGGRK